MRLEMKLSELSFCCDFSSSQFLSLSLCLLLHRNIRRRYYSHNQDTTTICLASFRFNHRLRVRRSGLDGILSVYDCVHTIPMLLLPDYPTAGALWYWLLRVLCTDDDDDDGCCLVSAPSLVAVDGQVIDYSQGLLIILVASSFANDKQSQ